MFEFIPYTEHPNQFINPTKPIPMLNFSQLKLNPASLVTKTESSTSNEQNIDDKPSSTESNQAYDDSHLNRRSNIGDDYDDEPLLKLFGCNNSAIPRAGNNQMDDSHQYIHQNHLNFHRQHSQLRRTNKGQHDEINSIPLRRLPYHPNQKWIQQLM